jgi:hypothetical protein
VNRIGHGTGAPRRDPVPRQRGLRARDPHAGQSRHARARRRGAAPSPRGDHGVPQPGRPHHDRGAAVGQAVARHRSACAGAGRSAGAADLRRPATASRAAGGRRLRGGGHPGLHAIHPRAGGDHRDEPSPSRRPTARWPVVPPSIPTQLSADDRRFARHSPLPDGEGSRPRGRLPVPLSRRSRDLANGSV